MKTPRHRPEHAALSAADEQSVAATQASYERIPYQTNPWTSAQPARLETVAKLHGIAAAPADDCRVLEIGCGDGGNLIPLASAHPRSEFVGVDLAAVHIETAQRIVRETAPGKVRFAAASFVDWGRDEAPFDYVIAHGLMSWLTPQLQELLFATVERLLAPQGVAFVSYNTLPGWAMQHSIRELLRHHNRGAEDIEKALDRSRTLLDTLVRTVPGKEVAYREQLEAVGAVARNPARRYYFAHEYLEDENHPFLVGDFVARAEANGLGYVGDADLIDCELDNMPEEPRALLEALAEGDTHRIQLLDFTVNRKFRQSLLCRGDVRRLPAPDLGRVREMYVSAALRCEALEAEGDEARDRVASAEALGFSDPHGRTIELDQPIAKAALTRFFEDSTHPIALPALVVWARERVGSDPAADPDEHARQVDLVALVFGRLLAAGMADVQASPPCWAAAPGARPNAPPMVRRAAVTGDRAPSLRHKSIALDNEAVRAVLERLDGTRDREALVRELDGRVEPAAIDEILRLAARNALLLR